MNRTPDETIREIQALLERKQFSGKPVTLEFIARRTKTSKHTVRNVRAGQLVPTGGFRRPPL